MNEQLDYNCGSTSCAICLSKPRSVAPKYHRPVCGDTATRFEDEEIQCDSRRCVVRPSTRYGKFVESDFTLKTRIAKESADVA